MPDDELELLEDELDEEELELDELELEELELELDELDELDDDDELPPWFAPPHAVTRKQNMTPEKRDKVFLPNESVADGLIGVLLFFMAVLHHGFVSCLRNE